MALIFKVQDHLALAKQQNESKDKEKKEPRTKLLLN